MIRITGPALAAALACGCASSALDRAQLSDPDAGPACAPRRKFSARFHVGQIARSSVVAPRAVAEQFFNCGGASAVLYFLEFADEHEAIEKAELIAGALWGGPVAPAASGEELLVRGTVAVIVSSADDVPPSLVAKLAEKGFAQRDPLLPTAAPRGLDERRGALAHIDRGQVPRAVGARRD